MGLRELGPEIGLYSVVFVDVEAEETGDIARFGRQTRRRRYFNMMTKVSHSVLNTLKYLLIQRRQVSKLVFLK